ASRRSAAARPARRSGRVTRWSGPTKGCASSVESENVVVACVRSSTRLKRGSAPDCAHATRASRTNASPGGIVWENTGRSSKNAHHADVSRGGAERAGWRPAQRARHGKTGAAASAAPRPRILRDRRRERDPAGGNSRTWTRRSRFRTQSIAPDLVVDRRARDPELSRRRLLVAARAREPLDDREA